jgi:heme/copper-type cytochrome/quinol oxidase subunit 2
MKLNPNKPLTRSAGLLRVALPVLLVAVGIAVAFLIRDSRNTRRGQQSTLWVPGSTPGRWTRSAAVAEFDNPGLRETGPGEMLLILNAKRWVFVPREVSIPVGTRLTIRARSSEEHHGFGLLGTDIEFPMNYNAINERTHTFNERGEFIFICSVYCGSFDDHEAMRGKIVVY